MGQFAALCKSARPHRPRGFDQKNPSGLESAALLRLGKKALASLTISLVLRSSLFSRSRSLMRARSSELTPSRMPSSTSCWRTQSLRVYGTQPILGAMVSMVAQRDGYSPRCSSTMRTVRSRTSGEKVLISCSWRHLLKVWRLLKIRGDSNSNFSIHLKSYLLKGIAANTADRETAHRQRKKGQKPNSVAMSFWNLPKLSKIKL